MLIKYSIEYTKEKSCIKAAFVAPKKNFKKAVDRNSIKRKMTAAFRQNKHTVYSHFNTKNITLNTLFIFNQAETVNYAAIEKAILQFNRHIVNKY